MNYTQLVPFNISEGGHTPLLCLGNVCKGYDIANKYDSAWEAWEHTEQHADSNVPTGVAVPLFYSYTVAIGGVTKNWGHINVQLPDGTVWSDGNIYSSIKAYTSIHWPEFVGWGESVNDIQIITEGEVMVQDQDVRNLWPEIFGAAPTDEDIKRWSGTSFQDFMYGVIGGPAFQAQQADYANWKKTGIALSAKSTQIKPGNYFVPETK